MTRLTPKIYSPPNDSQSQQSNDPVNVLYRGIRTVSCLNPDLHVAMKGETVSKIGKEETLQTKNSLYEGAPHDRSEAEICNSLSKSPTAFASSFCRE